MYERFFEDFNQDKKRLNAMRRSAPFTSQSRTPGVHNNMRQSYLNSFQNNIGLIGIDEVEEEKGSETDSMKQEDMRRK